MNGIPLIAYIYDAKTDRCPVNGDAFDVCITSGEISPDQLCFLNGFIRSPNNLAYQILATDVYDSLGRRIDQDSPS
jgi:hypothetical protein